jgi:hypothetical protein
VACRKADFGVRLRIALGSAAFCRSPIDEMVITLKSDLKHLPLDSYLSEYDSSFKQFIKAKVLQLHTVKSGIYGISLPMSRRSPLLYLQQLFLAILLLVLPVSS